MHCGTLKCVSIVTLTFLGHRSRDRSLANAHGPFPIGVPLVLTLYLQGKILRLKCIWVTVLTFLGHISVTDRWLAHIRVFQIRLQQLQLQ